MTDLYGDAARVVEVLDSLDGAAVSRVMLSLTLAVFRLP